MNTPMPRREFLKAAPLAAYGLARVAQGSPAPPPGGEMGAKLKIEPFNYQGVRLHPSRWQQQFQAMRDFYLGIPDDDILHGYRAAAGLPAPGKALGGWCRINSNTVFGQWLSGMARIYRATNDTAMRNKAIGLFTEWAKTVKPDGDCGMRHYPYEKLVCGLVDLKVFADFDEALPMLERVAAFASKNLSRENVPAGEKLGGFSGLPGEWYTLAENHYRAWQLTGNPLYKDLAGAWHYNSYWGKFEQSAAPPDAQGVHAYSHINSFSSAAMAYAVTGEEQYLRIIRNAYDWLQNLQCYATGGFGPSEVIAAPDGGLGRALEGRQDTFETGCGSWAAFKLSRYLMQFTGEARYGDWTERIFYNGIGSALPVTPEGKNFYYSDYRVAGGMKVHYLAAWACCAGTYIQAVADYHNIIYYKDADSLCVNLYVPSEVTWSRPGGAVKLAQETSYPEAETSTFTLELAQSQKFALKFRVPGWARDVSVRLNGAEANIPCPPGSWASLERARNSGDRVEIRIPLAFRMQAVDRQHPERVAIVRGPAVMVLEGDYHEPKFRLPDTDAELNHWLVAGSNPGWFNVQLPDQSRVRSSVRPFYGIGQEYPYKLYFDKKALPLAFW